MAWRCQKNTKISKLLTQANYGFRKTDPQMNLEASPAFRWIIQEQGGKCLSWQSAFSLHSTEKARYRMQHCNPTDGAMEYEDMHTLGNHWLVSLVHMGEGPG